MEICYTLHFPFTYIPRLGVVFMMVSLASLESCELCIEQLNEYVETVN